MASIADEARTRPIRDRLPNAIRTVVEPAESAVIAGSHMFECGQVDFVPLPITPDSVDRLEAASTEEAVDAARQLAPTGSKPD